MIRHFAVIFEGYVAYEDDPSRVPSADEIEKLLDDTLDILMETPNVQDATYSATAAKGAVEISLTVTAENFLEAQVLGNSAIRAGFHGAGGATPGWSLDWCRIATEEFRQARLDLVSAS